MRSLAVLLALSMGMSLGAPVVVARVQDGETKRPLVGVIVRSEGSDIMAVTDSGGQCLVVALPGKGRAVLASRTGYFDGRVVRGKMGQGVDWAAKDTVAIDVVLYSSRPRVVFGKVTDAGNRLVLVGARVALVGTELAESTQADGGFLFRQFPPRPHTLEVSAEGYPPRTTRVEARGGETTEVNVSLVDTANVGSLEGVASDAVTGTPVADARVVVDGTELGAATDSYGHYFIENVPVGAHKLLVGREGYVKAYTVVRLVRDWTVTVNLYLRAEAPPPVPEK